NERRRAARPARGCRHCGRTLSTPRRSTCDSCKREQANERRRLSVAATKPRPTACGCGAALSTLTPEEQQRGGAPRRYCDSCRRLRARTASLQFYYDHRERIRARSREAYRADPHRFLARTAVYQRSAIGKNDAASVRPVAEREGSATSEGA